jgi:Putative adhesin
LNLKFATLALLSISSLAFAADGTFDKTLSVSGPVTLNVSTGSGYIHVSPGSDAQVHIIGHVHASHSWMGGDNNADQVVKEIVANPPIDQTGSIVRVGKMKESWHNVAVDYEITAPKTTQLTGASGSGDLRIQGILGSVKLDTGSGSISVTGSGGSLNLETGSGDIHADQAAPGDVRVQTGSGSIHIGNVQGTLKAGTGSGDIEAGGKPVSEWKLETGSGNVTIAANNASFSVDASTGSGSVHSDLPMMVDGDLSKQHVKGKINGGGPVVRIETGSGSITLR